MPFRDPALALEHKLRLLSEERLSIDASIAEATSRLRELRGAEDRRASWSFAALVVALALVAFLVLSVRVLSDRGCSTPETRTRDRAVGLSDTAITYVAEHPGAECATVQYLVEQEYVHPDTDLTDERGNTFLIECAGDDINVVSAGSDEQFDTDDDIASDRDEP